MEHARAIIIPTAHDKPPAKEAIGTRSVAFANEPGYPMLVRDSLGKGVRIVTCHLPSGALSRCTRTNAKTLALAAWIKLKDRLLYYKTSAGQLYPAWLSAALLDFFS